MASHFIPSGPPLASIALSLRERTSSHLIQAQHNKNTHLKWWAFCHGAPGEIRTHDLRLRRATLYPAELQAQSPFIIQFLNKIIKFLIFVRRESIPLGRQSENFVSCFGNPDHMLELGRKTFITCNSCPAVLQS